MPEGNPRFWSMVVVCALAAAPGAARAQGAGECPRASPTFRVGHATAWLNVPGAFDPATLTTPEHRTIQVQLWYPARAGGACDGAAGDGQRAGGCDFPLASYASRLQGAHGELLSRIGWSPLSWSILGEGALEDAPLAGGDARFPVIVFSHGNQNDAIDYAYTLEALAAHGYVVAAPDHVGNTQDDVRIDFANAALHAAGQPLIPCLDGAPPDPRAGKAPVCSRPSVRNSMVDRYHDVEAVLDALPGWFGDRVDLARVGMMGHSRGTVTALAVAGGSAAWGLPPLVDDGGRPRIQALMGLAIGMQAVTSPVDVQKISVPVLLVGGTRDASGPLAVSEWAIDNLTSVAPGDKQLVRIQNAYHRHFDSAYCAELQSSGAIAQDALARSDPSAQLDLQTAAQILYHPTSGLAVDYCPLDAFTTPTNIVELAQTVTAGSVPGFTFPSSVPTSGLTADAVTTEVVQLAVGFFGQVLNRTPGDARPLQECLPAELRAPGDAPAPAPQERDAPAPGPSGARAVNAPLGPRGASVEDGGQDERCAFQDRDFYVSHVSTLPANAGEDVRLFVRERGSSCGPPVLMLTGATQPAMVAFDLPYQDYSWMTYLANAGFDVFAMDLQGYGLSTRPDVMDDPCNATTTVQKTLLTPNPLKAPCPVIASVYPYPFRLTNSQAEWDQIDAVVDDILAARGRERLSLVGWSQGGARAGGYASEHPDKVDRLFLYAPVYDRGAPTAPPVLPERGFPLAVSAVSAFFARWDSQARCPDQFDPGIRAELTASLLRFDPLAATWGKQPLWRSPSLGKLFGWNGAAAARLRMPVLLIRGDEDTQVPLRQVTDLFADVSSESRVFVHVACGAHQLLWDRQHTRLLDASVQWLREGRFEGERRGCFAVDVDGIATPDPGFAAPCAPEPEPSDAGGGG